VRRRLGASADTALVDSLVVRSEGVPFYAEELARSAAQGVKGLLGTLTEVLSARLGELTGDARQVMEAAAVGGADISEADVAAVLDLPGVRVDAALREGIDRQILTMTQGSAEFGFRHALLREAVLDSLLPGRLAALHRRWAQHLTATPAAATDAGRAVRVAQHWHAAHDTDHAFTASLTAARLLRSAAAPDEELRMLEQALSLWGAVPVVKASPNLDRAGIHQQAAQAALAAGETQRSLNHYASALEELDSAKDPVRCATVLLHRTLVTDSPTLASDSEIEQALQLLPASDPDSDVGRVRALGLVLRARARVIVGDYAGTESLAGEAIAYSRRSGNRRAESHAMSLLANAFDAVGRSEEALALRYERMPLLDGVEDPRERAGARINLVGTLMQLHRLQEALDVAGEGVALSHELGVYRSEGALYAGMVAECLVEVGRWDDAAALCRETLDVRPAPEAALELMCLAATIAILRGDQSADDEVQRMQAWRARVDDPWFIWRLATVRALDALERQKAASALAVLGQAIKDPDAVDHPSLAGPLLHAAARALAASAQSVDGLPGDLTMGDVTERLDALPPGVATPVWRALSAAELAGPAHQVQTWSTCVSLLEDGLEGFAYERAHALYRLGQAHLAAGAPNATTTLRRAQEQAEHLRALPLLRRIVEVTRAGRSRAPTGGGGRRPSPGNPFGLTGREHEVLSLVGDGLSNGDIAKRLFISPKTASVHISNILRKLGVTNRGQAAEKARELGLLTSDHDASTDDAVVGPVSEGP
jgi:DNA-binding CsgD family transcriptional regulator/tetratricopeptide (TPR) repeat protein